MPPALLGTSICLLITRPSLPPPAALRPRSFRVNTRMAHDLTVSDTEQGSVFMDGSGEDLNFDHHRCGHCNVGRDGGKAERAGEAVL